MAKWNLVLKISCFVLLGVSFVLAYLLIEEKADDRVGRIIYTDIVERKLYLMNRDNRLMYMSQDSSGPVSWSPDGNRIAVVCEDGKAICILDVSGTKEIGFITYGHTPTIEQTITYPTECTTALEKQHYEFEEKRSVTSISWAPDGNRLSIVCPLGAGHPSVVCILALDHPDQENCWTTPAGDIVRADWSPAADLLALSQAESLALTQKLGGQVIYLASPDGANWKEFTQGWAAEWAPDGRRMAFFRHDPIDKDDWNIGIGVIDANGRHFRWVYQNDPEAEAHWIEKVYPLCHGLGKVCKISWSPDQRYLVFSGHVINIHGLKLFLLNLRTQEVRGISFTEHTINESDWHW